MRADRRDAVRVGATQAEIHATAQIRHRPVRAIRGRRKAGIVKRAVDIRTALDGVAFVEMGVNVDQRRPYLTAADVDLCDAVIAFSARPFDAGELAVFDQQVRVHHAFRVNGRRQSSADRQPCKPARAH